MVFSSVPAYLDLPNWHQLQQPNHQQGSVTQNPQIPPPPTSPHVGVATGEGSIRPGSMVDRARLAKLPLPEAGLNCPRCDSTNTKFCYFNNYNFTQPRHFCKTCRRYWTRGGALRSVPVGGGCRRNKRSKSRSSKSPITNNDRQTGPNSISESPSSCSSEMTNHFSPQLPLVATLQNLSHYGAGNFGGFQPQTDTGFQIGSSSGGNDNVLSARGTDGWRLPILAGFEQPTNLFLYQGEGVVEAPSSGITQVAPPVKVEENRGLNLSRQFLGISENNNNNQYWGGNGNTWTDFSGHLNSSSTSHFL